MVDTITATYVQHEDEWTVIVTGFGQELHATAPGIIAARDHAEQLVDQLAPEEIRPTVVHLLDGSALQFTAAYMSARLARTDIGRMGDAEENSTGEPHTGEQSLAAAQDRTGEQGTAPQSEVSRQASAVAAEERDTAGNSAQASPPQVPAQARTVPRKKLSKTPETVEDGHPQGEDGASSPARTAAEYVSTAASGVAGGTDEQA